MNEDLDALEKIKELYKSYVEKIGLNEKDILGFDLSFACIEKTLKALEIIKEDFFTFIDFKEEKRETKTYYFIDFNRGDYRVYLSKEKQDLLKEVLL